MKYTIKYSSIIMLSILISLKAFAASNINNTDNDGYAWAENVGGCDRYLLTLLRIAYAPYIYYVTSYEVTSVNIGHTHVGWIHFKNTNPAYKVRQQLLAEINVKANNTDIADGDTTASTNDDTDFGNVTVGSNVTHTFTIQNTGGAELNLTDSTIVTVTGNGFTVTTQPSSTVAVNGETSFVVQFAPGVTDI